MKYLASKLKIRQSGCQDWITVRAPSLTKPGFLHDLDRRRILVYPAERNQFIVNVGNVPDVKAQENTGN
jgi:hypothetical protein